MSDFDFFYEEDYNVFNNRVKISQYNNSRIFLVGLTGISDDDSTVPYMEYSVNLMRKKYKQINDITIFPKHHDTELYDFVVSQLALKAEVPLALIKKQFIHEQ